MPALQNGPGQDGDGPEQLALPPNLLALPAPPAAAPVLDEFPRGRALSDIKYKVAETGGPWYIEVGVDKKIPLSNTIGYRANET